MEKMLGFRKKDALQDNHKLFFEETSLVIPKSKLVPVVSEEEIEKAFWFIENRKMECPEDADELEDIFSFLRKRLLSSKKKVG